MRFLRTVTISICKWFKNEPTKPEQEKIELDQMEKIDFVPEWYNFAKMELGILEIPGPKHNPRILEYLATVNRDFKADEIAWCSAFVNWCLARASAAGTNKANARSWLSWGRMTRNPQLGDVVIFWRESLESWKGHVGFYSGEKNGKILLLSGNQKNKVSFQYYSKSKLLGFRTMRPV